MENLNFLFWGYAVGWTIIFLYLFQIGRRESVPAPQSGGPAGHDGRVVEEITHRKIYAHRGDTEKNGDFAEFSPILLLRAFSVFSVSPR